MRIRTHEIETEARRRVASALPAAWVERDQTGRDYGNDLTVELFDDGQPTGSELDLQIKGRDAAWAVESDLRTQFPVKTLLYAEQRSVPFLAAICPIQEPAPTFGFVWVQEYIRIVLDVERPGWRQQSGVTLVVPADNRMPGSGEKLRWIAGFPQRMAAIGQLAGAAHELRYQADVIADAGEPDTGRAVALLAEAQRFAQNLPPEWPEVELVRSGLVAVDLLRRGQAYTPEEVRSLGWGIGNEYAAINELMVRDHLRTVAERLESYASIHNNAAIRRGLWELEGEHLF